jgi:hypothetical protein
MTGSWRKLHNSGSAICAVGQILLGRSDECGYHGREMWQDWGRRGLWDGPQGRLGVVGGC